MVRQAMDLLMEEHPGYTIHVSEATNTDRGLRAYVKRLFTGTIVSVRAEYENTKTDTEMAAFYLLVADVGNKKE
jgi:hypothetical protein